ncbi:MAG: THUMP domain-containing protein [Nanobdellota archaeon]
MIQPVGVVRTSEISLKGKNRHIFEKRLVSNLKKSLKAKGLSFQAIKRLRGRILLYFDSLEVLDQAEKVFSVVFGVASFSSGVLCVNNLDEIKKALDLLPNQESRTFRVSCKRQDKSFFMSSPAVEKELGEFLVKKHSKIVDLKNYEEEFLIEICEEGSIVSKGSFSGPGGLPVGSSARVGIFTDYQFAELAGVYMLKRGCEVVFLGEIETSFIDVFNNFRKPISAAPTDSSGVLGTMDKFSLKALVAGGDIRDFLELKRNFPGCLVLSPLVGLSRGEIDKKQKFLAKNI